MSGIATPATTTDWGITPAEDYYSRMAKKKKNRGVLLRWIFCRLFKIAIPTGQNENCKVHKNKNEISQTSLIAVKMKDTGGCGSWTAMPKRARCRERCHGHRGSSELTHTSHFNRFNINWRFITVSKQQMIHYCPAKELCSPSSEVAEERTAKRKSGTGSPSNLAVYRRMSRAKCNK